MEVCAVTEVQFLFLYFLAIGLFLYILILVLSLFVSAHYRSQLRASDDLSLGKTCKNKGQSVWCRNGRGLLVSKQLIVSEVKLIPASEMAVKLN
jgi:hypothetical protein